MPVKARFVYKIKRMADGAVERCKARRMARDFVQRRWIDVFEALSPAVGLDVVRTVLATSTLHE